MSATLTIELFDHCYITYKNKVVESITTPRQQSLLAYLLLRCRSPQPRQKLAFLFWPDSEESQARTNLRRELHHLRQALPDEQTFLCVDSKTLQWLPDAPFSLDVDNFEVAVSQGKQVKDPTKLAKAVEFYKGDLLAACYDEWLLPERERLRQLCLEVLSQLTSLLEEERQFKEAINYAQRLLRLDPLQESITRKLMRLHLSDDDRAGALRVYHSLVRALEHELDIGPSPATKDLYQRLINETQQVQTSTPKLGTPLIGRKQAWQHLVHEWQRAAKGHAQHVAIHGVAGIGKTRLAEELLTWSRRQGQACARSRCYAAEGRLAYGPVTDWLRTNAMQKSLYRLEDVWLCEIARLLPELSLAKPELPKPEPLRESWQRQRFFEALARAFLITGEPLLLLVDDLQWCDKDTLEWLHYLLRFDPNAKLLLVTTIRSEELSDNPTLPDFLFDLGKSGLQTGIELPPLNETDTAILTTHITGQALEPEQQQTFFQATEGHPLFVVEMARVNAPSLQASFTETTLPPKIHAVIMARLTQLSSQAKELAQMAATVGRAFRFDILLEASTLPEGDVVNALDELWQRRIIREHKVGYDFSHDRIREVAYQTLSPIKRRLMHQRIAAALERLDSSDLDSISAQLADHYEQTAQWRKAVAFYKRAADVAARVYANAEVIQLLIKGLALLENLADSIEKGELELDMQIALGVAYVAVDGYGSDAARAAFSRAENLSRHLDQPPSAPILRGRALNHLSRSELGKAYDYGEQMLEQAIPTGDPVLMVEAHYVLGVTRFWQAQFEDASLHFGQALNLYVSEHSNTHIALYSQDPKVVCLARLGHTLWYLGYPEQAKSLCHEALELAQNLAHPLSLAYALIFAIWLANDVDDSSEIQHHTQTLLQLWRGQKLGFFNADCIVLEGWAQFKAGDQEVGISRLEEGLATIKASKQILHLSFQLSLAIRAYMATGELEKAQGALENALEMSKRTGEHFLDAELYRFLAKLHVKARQSQEAETALRQALKIAKRQHAKSLELRAATDLSRLWLSQGRPQEAYELLGSTYTWFTEGFDTADLRVAKELLHGTARP